MKKGMNLPRPEWGPSFGCRHCGSHINLNRETGLCIDCTPKPRQDEPRPKTNQAKIATPEERQKIQDELEAIDAMSFTDLIEKWKKRGGGKPIRENIAPHKS